MSKSRIDHDPTDPRHGTYNGYVNLFCRCDRCRAANTEQTAVFKARRRARLSDPGLVLEHGHTSTYFNWGCRCRDCKDAKARYERARYVRR
jgi:hypothetical protein